MSTLAVGYAGRDGAHAATACDELFPCDRELVPLPSFTAVVDAAVTGDVQFGVLPIESSLSGPVAETHDLLQVAPLSIASEAVLRIRHCLLGPEEVPLEDVRIVRSHPVALDQCRRLIAAMPWATAIASGTTAEAAAEVASEGDPSQVAIAGEQAAALYGLQLISADVGDHPEAYTRFVSVTNSTRLDRTDESWRTAFSFVTDHQPGRASSRDRALRTARNRPRAARLPADPRYAVAVLLPRRARRPSARRADPERPDRGDGEDPPPEGVRLLPGRRGPVMSETAAGAVR